MEQVNSSESAADSFVRIIYALMWQMQCDDRFQKRKHIFAAALTTASSTGRELANIDDIFEGKFFQQSQYNLIQ